jgi:hypothetical protein
MRPTRLSLVGVLAVLTMSGCGGGSDVGGGSVSATRPEDSAGSGTSDACELITTDQVAQVLGDHSTDHAAYSVTATTGPDGSCTFAWTVNGSGDEFTVDVFPASGFVAQPGIELREIPGVGDEAFEESGSFYARVGDQMVNIVNVQEGEGSDEALLAIAAGNLAKP